MSLLHLNTNWDYWSVVRVLFSFLGHYAYLSVCRWAIYVSALTSQTEREKQVKCWAYSDDPSLSFKPNLKLAWFSFSSGGNARRMPKLETLVLKLFLCDHFLLFISFSFLKLCNCSSSRAVETRYMQSRYHCVIWVWE